MDKGDLWHGLKFLTWSHGPEVEQHGHRQLHFILKSLTADIAAREECRPSLIHDGSLKPVRLCTTGLAVLRLHRHGALRFRPPARGRRSASARPANRVSISAEMRPRRVARRVRTPASAFQMAGAAGASRRPGSTSDRRRLRLTTRACTQPPAGRGAAAMPRGAAKTPPHAENRPADSETAPSARGCPRYGDSSPKHNLVNCFCILLTADIISTVEFNCSGDLLATGDKGGRVVIFQREQENKSRPHPRGEYNVYSTFQSHEPEFDYLKSLEIEEKINKIRWLPQQNAAHFLLSTNDKTIKLWKISERDKRAEGYNLKDEDGRLRDPFRITALRVPILKPMDLMVEASPRRIFANAHTYHINSISVNSDHETYLSADDLRINLWHLEITDRSFNIVDIKPANMEELTEVITAAEFHPHQCNVFVYSSSKGTIRLCDMRSSALCDRHSKFFEEPEDPSSRSFFSEIISSISDVKFSHSGRYMMTRDYLSVKVWDLNMESRPVETHQVHEYLRSKLCSLYENDCIFDKFECCWNGSDR
ncbi:serine/threonine-protein phosphatase 2A 55 kDa regulatory subunit B delta isoform-like [Carlito syrichta]|uniref:Serine/threonine-protein phosphatase 2A 55 kDa regulatory subunit B n=2 Tax=Haplorrhini TaxID=376913 RepID=A0A3Q0DQ50_CARSF|nr:serine/threonine-protein phosphatase 2A 55 kDa regulatory subunit B delta isoform-like [Carlito syrichta]